MGWCQKLLRGGKTRKGSKNMIKEIAIADAYAQAFEFVKNPETYGLKNRLVDGKLNFQQNPKYPELKPGNFTDDTIRTIASCWTMMELDHDRFPHNLPLESYFVKIKCNRS
jgi:hypothetical protein